MKTKQVLIALMLVVVLATAAGCGKGEANRADEPVRTEPVTLKLYNWDMITDEMFFNGCSSNR